MKKILAEVDRRNFFRYLGNAAVFYPFMRTMFETEVFGANNAKRAVFFYFPSGVISSYFHPTAMGALGALPLTTAPLAAVKNDIVILKGVDYKTGHSHNEGTRYCLTGGNSGPSLDTTLGDKFKDNVKLPVMRVGINSQLRGGYDSAVSWNPTGNPSTIEDNPKKAFAAAFGGAGFALAETDPNKISKSVLDFCVEDIKSLQTRLGSIEKQKLDYHLSSLRELERRIQVSTMPTTPDPITPGGGGGGGVASCTKTVDYKGLVIPDANAEPVYHADENFHKIGGIMMDIAVQSLACGVTNVALVQFMHSIDDVFLMNFPGGPGIPAANHSTSHHDFNAEKMLMFAKIQAYFMDQFATLTTKMKAVAEGDKNLLYNSVSLAFSELADPGSHEMENVGLVIAGQAGGKIKTGQAIDATGKTQGDVLGVVSQAMGLGTGGSIPGLFT
ncbi:MAG: DUF1552 domain-containing protein [Proteobacteria bacterium]|nr:MAG: DUF1552 domain-containing protein [Pseudomonadota bacterium]